MAEFRITEDNVWQYYRRLSNFRARCKFCSNTYTYIHITNFVLHLSLHKDKYQLIANKKLNDTPMEYYNKSLSICIICCQGIQSGHFKNHLYSHTEKEIEDYEYSNVLANPRDHFEQRDDWYVNCNFCLEPRKLKIQSFLTLHTHKHIKNGQCVIGSHIANESDIWKNYTKVETYKARCNFCYFYDYYINISNFSQHVRTIHEKTTAYEESCRKEWPWIYFKFAFQDVFVFIPQCVICKEKIVYNNDNDLIIHLRESHMLDNSNYFYSDWIWKYCKLVKETNGPFKVICTLCPIGTRQITLNGSLDYSRLTDHNVIHLKKTEMQRTYDMPGPSRSQPN